MRRTLATVLGLAVILFSFAAQADRDEINVIPSLSPELLHLTVPTRGSSSTTKPTVGFSLSGFYGVTNSLHLGVELHYAGLRNVPFEQASLLLDDGSTPTGTLYADSALYGASAFAMYRMDLPSAIVPVFRLGAGPVFASYGNLALYPSQAQFRVDTPDQSEVGFAISLSAGAQYRIGNHWLASASLEVRRNLGLHVPWELALPLSVGYVW